MPRPRPPRRPPRRRRGVGTGSSIRARLATMAAQTGSGAVHQAASSRRRRRLVGPCPRCPAVTCQGSAPAPVLTAPPMNTCRTVRPATMATCARDRIPARTALAAVHRSRMAPPAITLAAARSTIRAREAPVVQERNGTAGRARLAASCSGAASSDHWTSVRSHLAQGRRSCCESATQAAGSGSPGGGPMARRPPSRSSGIPRP